MAEELFDIVDENGNPTGKTVSRSEAHAKGIRHRTAHIWVIRDNEGKKEVLLQKRSLKASSGLIWKKFIRHVCRRVMIGSAFQWEDWR